MCSGNGSGEPGQGRDAVNQRTGKSYGWLPGSFGGPRRNGKTDRKPKDPTKKPRDGGLWFRAIVWVTS